MTHKELQKLIESIDEVDCLDVDCEDCEFNIDYSCILLEVRKIAKERGAVNA